MYSHDSYDHRASFSPENVLLHLSDRYQEHEVKHPRNRVNRYNNKSVKRLDTLPEILKLEDLSSWDNTPSNLSHLRKRNKHKHKKFDLMKVVDQSRLDSWRERKRLEAEQSETKGESLVDKSWNAWKSGAYDGVPEEPKEPEIKTVVSMDTVQERVWELIFGLGNRPNTSMDGMRAKTAPQNKSRNMTTSQSHPNSAFQSFEFRNQLKLGSNTPRWRTQLNERYNYLNKQFLENKDMVSCRDYSPCSPTFSLMSLEDADHSDAEGDRWKNNEESEEEELAPNRFLPASDRNPVGYRDESTGPSSSLANQSSSDKQSSSDEQSSSDKQSVSDGTQRRQFVSRAKRELKRNVSMEDLLAQLEDEVVEDELLQDRILQDTILCDELVDEIEPSSKDAMGGGWSDNEDQEDENVSLGLAKLMDAREQERKDSSASLSIKAANTGGMDQTSPEPLPKHIKTKRPPELEVESSQSSPKAPLFTNVQTLNMVKDYSVNMKQIQRPASQSSLQSPTQISCEQPILPQQDSRQVIMRPMSQQQPFRPPMTNPYHQPNRPMSQQQLTRPGSLQPPPTRPISQQMARPSTQPGPQGGMRMFGSNNGSRFDRRPMTQGSQGRPQNARSKWRTLPAPDKPTPPKGHSVLLHSRAGNSNARVLKSGVTRQSSAEAADMASAQHVRAASLNLVNQILSRTHRY